LYDNLLDVVDEINAVFSIEVCDYPKYSLNT
jgi:hypothetical protein